MSSIKIYLLFTLAILCFSNVDAQKTGFYWHNLDMVSNRLQGKLQGEIYAISAIENEFFFLQREWQNSTVTLIDGDVFENVKLRYMAYGDEIVAYNENVRTLFKIDKETVKEFTFMDGSTNEIIKFSKFCSETPNQCRYYQELYSGNSKLLAFHFVEEVKVSPYTDKGGIMRDSEFKKNVAYFLSNEIHELVKIQKKRRSFVRNFPEKKREIKRLLRKNKILIIDQNSFVQAFILLDEAGIFY